MAKKGITTIIAILLAIVLTLALASSTFFFVSKTQKSTQEQGTRSSSEYLVKLASCIKIMSVKYQTTKFLEITVKNCGYRDVDPETEKINLLVETGGSSCIATINSSNCPDCKKIFAGSMAPIRINASAVRCENINSDLSSYIESNFGKATSLTLSIKYAYAGTTFVPEYTIPCAPTIWSPCAECYLMTRELNYSFEVGNNAAYSDVIDINIRLARCHSTSGNNITLYNSSGECTSSGNTCSGSVLATTDTTRLNYHNESLLNLQPGESKSFCVYVRCANPDSYLWGTVINVCSNNCQGKCTNGGFWIGSC
jgi:archaellum component FlaG (FlaF/FlaG flagellin family)